MALEQQDINSTQLLHVTVLFELLTDLGTDSGDGHTQGVHGLDFGGLSARQSAIHSVVPFRIESTELP